jgi:hypothetical protein
MESRKGEIEGQAPECQAGEIAKVMAVFDRCINAQNGEYAGKNEEREERAKEKQHCWREEP